MVDVTLLFANGETQTVSVRCGLMALMVHEVGGGLGAALCAVPAFAD